MHTRILFHIAFLILVSYSVFGVAQTREDFEACTRIITRMCGPISPSNRYVQVNVKRIDGSTLESLDQGWLLAEEQDFKTILNDRLLVRSYYTSHQDENKPSFEIVPIEDEPLSKAEHAHAMAVRRQRIHRIAETNTLLGDELLRYPLLNDEMSRLVHILIQSMTNPAQIDHLIGHAKDIEFERASVFRINGCDCIAENATWQENGMCCLSNCYLTQAFSKIADSKNTPMDECIDFIGKLVREIEDGSIRCSRLEDIKTAERRLLVWKSEKAAIDNRLMFFPTPHDVALSFLMSSGNIPLGDRSINFEASHYVEREQIWSVKENVDACANLSDCNLPTRYVVADRGEGLFILSVGSILRLCGPKEPLVSRSIYGADK